jgi:hypothetical protein
MAYVLPLETVAMAGRSTPNEVTKIWQWRWQTHFSDPSPHGYHRKS